MQWRNFLEDSVSGLDGNFTTLILTDAQDHPGHIQMDEMLGSSDQLVLGSTERNLRDSSEAASSSFPLLPKLALFKAQFNLPVFFVLCPSVMSNKVKQICLGSTFLSRYLIACFINQHQFILLSD